MFFNKKHKEFEEVCCILCGKRDTGIIGRKGQFGFPVYVSICKNDGLVYLSPRWKKDRYKQFYSEEYYDNYYKIDMESKKSIANRYSNIEKIWKRIENFNIKKVYSVLDIGSGMGWSLNFLKKKIGDHIFISAIEPSNICKNHIIDEIGAELLTDDVDSNWHLNNKNRFDLIIMRHVLEHLLYPIEVLQKLYEVLSPNGLLYIAVPDMMAPRGSFNNYWFRVVHTYYYCKDTLEHLLQRLYFETLTIKTDNSEVWGIFKKGERNSGLTIRSVYEEQMEIIKHHKRKYYIRDNILHPIMDLFPKDNIYQIKSFIEKFNYKK